MVGVIIKTVHFLICIERLLKLMTVAYAIVIDQKTTHKKTACTKSIQAIFLELVRNHKRTLRYIVKRFYYVFYLVLPGH